MNAQLQVRTCKGRPQTWGLYAPSSGHWWGFYDMVITSYAAMRFPTPDEARKYRRELKRKVNTQKKPRQNG